MQTYAIIVANRLGEAIAVLPNHVLSFNKCRLTGILANGKKFRLVTRDRFALQVLGASDFIAYPFGIVWTKQEIEWVKHRPRSEISWRLPWETDL